mmetsp:Transcript_20019/g.41835  ORF Transcript_20019/g.41835 Transcript_20019/m.41835 type:complete len:105 (-) Transcript_20019:2487-2801(-)
MIPPRCRNHKSLFFNSKRGTASFPERHGLEVPRQRLRKEIAQGSDDSRTLHHDLLDGPLTALGGVSHLLYVKAPMQIFQSAALLGDPNQRGPILTATLKTFSLC